MKVRVCYRLGCDPKDTNLRCMKPEGHKGPGDAWFSWSEGSDAALIYAQAYEAGKKDA